MLSKKNIVFVSIANDLYGSSKVLLSLVLKIKAYSEEYNPIVCVPNEKGPLKDFLIRNNIEIIEMPVVKLTRSMLGSLRFISILKDYNKARNFFKNEIKNRKIEIIQSNTLATLFGSFYCFFRKTKHVFHVHEIMDRPWFVKFFFTSILFFFSDKIVYNSSATEEFYNKTCSLLKRRSTTILNGVDRESKASSEEEIVSLRSDILNSDKDNILIGLIGRFNRLKGHGLLLESFKDLSKIHPDVKLCFVGSTPNNQEHYYTSIIAKIGELQLNDKVEIIGFKKDIYPIIDALDVIVVPSTEPESFGVIAVEAMLSHKAVVASNIGGLANVVVHNETGLLFEPNNKEDLTKSLERLISDPGFKSKLEQNAYNKSVNLFSTETMYRNFNETYSSMC